MCWACNRFRSSKVWWHKRGWDCCLGSQGCNCNSRYSLPPMAHTRPPTLRVTTPSLLPKSPHYSILHTLISHSFSVQTIHVLRWVHSPLGSARAPWANYLLRRSMNSNRNYISLDIQLELSRPPVSVRIVKGERKKKNVFLFFIFFYPAIFRVLYSQRGHDHWDHFQVK